MRPGQFKKVGIFSSIPKNKGEKENFSTFYRPLASLGQSQERASNLSFPYHQAKNSILEELLENNIYSILESLRNKINKEKSYFFSIIKFPFFTTGYFRKSFEKNFPIDELQGYSWGM